MGIGYDDGAAIEQAQAALRMYNLYFWRRLEYATFDMVKLNIQNYAPMYMRGSGYDSSGKLSGHAVTIYGYKETGGEKCLMIWDPAANENKGDTYMVSYNGAGTVYTSAPNSTIFTWQGTLLCYK